MRLSAKGEYAIKAMLDLAVHDGNGLQPIQEIASRQGIPQRYLEQVLLQLKRGGMLASKRGSAGGYRLHRCPDEITVGAVLRAVEGAGDLERGGRPRVGGASHSDDLGDLWREIAEALSAVLDRVSFGDLKRGSRSGAARPDPCTTSDFFGLDQTFPMGMAPMTQRGGRSGSRPKVAESVLDLVGATPLIRLNRVPRPGSAVVLGKMESLNPGGSVKDRIAVSMIEDAERRGLLGPGATVVEPTSGNTGIGLAMVCAVRGYRLILTMPDDMSVERQRLLARFGAEIHLTPAIEGMTGAVYAAQELCREHPGAFMPQQFENPANPDVHRRTTALRDPRRHRRAGSTSSWPAWARGAPSPVSARCSRSGVQRCASSGWSPRARPCSPGAGRARMASRGSARPSCPGS